MRERVVRVVGKGCGKRRECAGENLVKVGILMKKLLHNKTQESEKWVKIEIEVLGEPW